jgi:hypothetical protein
MLRKFDILEKLPDGSLTWRACAFGQFEAERKLLELAEHLENELLAVDIQTGEPLAKLMGQTQRRAIKKAANG